MPVPSYTLRATAVCRPDEEEQLLARTPSIHSNISIFKFYLDQNEAHTSVNHKKKDNISSIHYNILERQSSKSNYV